MAHTDRRLLHGLTHIRKTSLLRGHALKTKQARQQGYDPVRREGTAGNLLACIDGNIHHRPTQLQQYLTTGDILDEGLGLWEPRLVPLEEKSYAIERHTRLLVEPRVMGVHMEEQTVHPQSEVMV